MSKLKNPELHPTIVRKYNMHRYYKAVNQLLEIPAEQCEHINLDIRPQRNTDHIDLITIAFNNTYVLESQIKKIKKNVLDKNYTHIIADNSSDFSRRKEIKNICEKEKIAYISLPSTKKSVMFFNSESHAIALNWMYYNLIRKRSPRWFGCLDHDIYPLKPISIQDKLWNQSFYGRKDVRGHVWYLWPGFAFFELSSLDSVDVNFFPSKSENVYLDTGGAMWHVYFKNLNEIDYSFAKNIRVSLNQLGSEFNEDVEFIDDIWFHSMNGSFWRNVPDYKSAIEDILNNDNFLFPDR
jgi:hypothetical protein